MSQAYGLSYRWLIGAHLFQWPQIRHHVLRSNTYSKPGQFRYRISLAFFRMFERVYNRTGLSCSAKIYAKQRTDNELCLYAKWNRFQSKDMLCEDKNCCPYPWGYSGTRGAIPVSSTRKNTWKHARVYGNAQ